MFSIFNKLFCFKNIYKLFVVLVERLNFILTMLKLYLSAAAEAIALLPVPGSPYNKNVM